MPLVSFAAASVLSRAVCSRRADLNSAKTGSISLSWVVRILAHKSRIRSS